VRARAPERAGVLTGAYSMSLVAGATVATFLAIPFEHAFGGWEAALAIWAIPALAAVAVWIPLAVRAHDPVPAPVGHPLWRDATAWSIALFMGLQSMAFFSSITWLPEIFEANGASEGYAGFLSGLTQLIQVLPAFAIPVLATRRPTQAHLLAVIVCSTLAGLLGVLLAPGVGPLWMVILGIGQGGALGLGLILPVLRGRDAGQVAGMTAMAMGVGYLIASTGPAIVGAVHDATGDWTWPVIALIGMTVVQAPAGWRAVTAGRAAGRS
jgi:CP family cyanate transporter-like MFS transporter